MAVKKGGKKSPPPKSKKGAKKEAAPKVEEKKVPKPKRIHATKDSVSQSKLLDSVLSYMEDENQIKKSVGKDFMASLEYALLEFLGDFKAVSIGKVVKITPRIHDARKGVEVFKEWGNPDAGKHKIDMPASVKLAAKPLKQAKDAVPEVSKARAALKKQGK